MDSLIWLGIRGFLLTLILTPIIRDIFGAYGIVDRPDGTRKMHRYPIPRVGGIAVAISYFVAYYSASLFSDGLLPHQISLVVMLLPAAAVVFIIGLIDDFVGLKPWHKLCGQMAAASLAYWAGVRVLSLAGHPLQNWESFAATALWLLACTNAFNLIDGLDGLAAGIGLFATLTIFAAALAGHNAELAAATLPLAGCLLAFLCYNFNPATIFLGDCGSLLIGFLLGCFGVMWSQKSVTAMGMTAPLIALSLPLIDVSIAILRRFLRRQPVFRADHGHIHHRLLDRGLNPRRAVLVIYGVCGVAALSLLQGLAGNRYVSAMAGAVFLLASLAGIRYLGYTEFTIAGRFLRLRAFRRLMGGQLALENVARQFAAAATIEDCWAVIRKEYTNLGFRGVHLEVAGTVHRQWPAGIAGEEYWTIRIPLTEDAFLELARDFRSDDMPSAVAQVADLLRDILRSRLDERPREMAARSGVQ